MATLFGKNYLEAGKSSSPLLLRSNGEIKLLWGNKFIDLIKNGKINTQSKEFISEIETSDSIEDTGIYLVTLDNSIWICVNGTKMAINNTDNSYISFTTKLELTAENKDLALTNIGFYYDTINDAKDILTGLIFVKDTGKLYVISNGISAEVNVLQNTKFDSLTIGDCKITSKSIDIDTINAKTVNATDVSCSNLTVDSITNSNETFKLKTLNNKSILTVDSLNWTNMDSEIKEITLNKYEYTINGEFNVITEFSRKDDLLVEATLKYSNMAGVGTYWINPKASLPAATIEVLLDYNRYIATTLHNEDGTYTYTFDRRLPYDLTSVTLHNTDLGATTLSAEKCEPYGFTTKKLVAYIFFSTTSGVEYKINVDNKYMPYTPLDVVVTEVTDTSIIFKATCDDMLEELLTKSNCRVFKACVNLFIQKDNCAVLRRWTGSKYKETTYIGTYTTEEDDPNNPNGEKKKVEHFGLYSEDIVVTGVSSDSAKFTGNLPTYDGKAETAEENDIPTMKIVNTAIDNKVKVVSDKVSELETTITELKTNTTNTNTKVNEVYASMQKWSLTFQETSAKVTANTTNITTLQNNLNTTNANVTTLGLKVTALENKPSSSSDSLPIGTIVMWSSTTKPIPNGWAVCNGSNGTPDLRGYYIKGGENIGWVTPPDTEVRVSKTTDTDTNGTTVVKAIKSYTLIFIMKVK